MAKPWYAAQKGYDSVGTHRLAALTHDIRYENDGMTKEAERWRLVFIHDGQKHAVTAGDGGELGRKVQAQLTKFDIPSNSEVSQDIVQCLLHTMGHPLAPKKPSPAQQMGTLLDTLAVLREIEGTLTQELTRHLANHPELIRGSKLLSVEDRIQNTVNNRQDLGRVVAESTRTPGISEKEFRTQLEHSEPTRPTVSPSQRHAEYEPGD